MNKLGKTPSETAVTMTELVLPNDTNLLGNLLGGTLMHWMDIACALTATRHANKTVATVSVDKLLFKHPVRMGEMVILNAKVTYVGNTSIHTCVEVFAENLTTGHRMLCNTANLVFVALNDEARPTPVPAFLPETEQEIALYNKIKAKLSKNK